MKLIENWKQAWRFVSVWLTVIGSTIASVLIAFPDAALTVWSALPQEMKDAIPAQYMPLIGVGVALLSVVGRVIKQTKLENKDILK